MARRRAWVGLERWSTLVAVLFRCLCSTAKRCLYSVRMVDARKILKATIAETPYNTGLWIVHVSFAAGRWSMFALGIVGVWLRRGCMRLFGIQFGILVWGRVVVHLSWRLARSVRPYVTGENVGSVTTCACGVPSRSFEVK